MEYKCPVVLATKDKESVPNAMEEVSTSTMVNPARNVKEDTGINVIIADALAAVLAMVIDCISIDVIYKQL